MLFADELPLRGSHAAGRDAAGSFRDSYARALNATGRTG